MNMNEQNELEALQSSGIALLRARLGQILNSLGITLSNSSASLLSWAIILVLLVNIFFVLNLAGGFLLGQLFGSTGLGFLALVGFYCLLLIIYLVLRPRTEAYVQDQVARRVHHITDNLNTELNQVPALRVEQMYREAFISSEPSPYHALTLRRDEAKRQADRAGRDLKEGVAYLKENYMKVFGTMATNRFPALRYIAPIKSLAGSAGELKSKKAKPKAESQLPKALGTVAGYVHGIRPYLPYVATAYKYLSPVVSTFVVAKTQSWLLGKLLGFGKKKKK